MNRSKPLASCLMVTTARQNRFKLLKKSVACYVNQTYPNKELVMVLDQPETRDIQRLERYIESLKRPDIRIVHITTKQKLGVLRNISMDDARGRILCQWDDDDLSHPQRMEFQISALLQQGTGGICLQRIFHFFEESRELFPVNWKRDMGGGHAASFARFKKSRIRYAEQDPWASSGEDALYLGQYGERQAVGALCTPPYLYAYVCHGANTCSDQHIRDLTLTVAISKVEICRNKEALNKDLALFDFGPGPLQVMSKTGLVYSLPSPIYSGKGSGDL